MKTICILVISQNQLLSHSLKSVLGLDTDIHVIFSLANDLPAMIATAGLYQPAVVVFDRQTTEIIQEAITRLLIAQPHLKVIVINAETNWLQVFQKEDILLTESVELIDLIRSF